MVACDISHHVMPPLYKYPLCPVCSDSQTDVDSAYSAAAYSSHLTHKLSAVLVVTPNTRAIPLVLLSDTRQFIMDQSPF